MNISLYSPLLQFGCSGFYNKAAIPSRWLAPGAEDSDMEVEADSDLDDSDLDPDYVAEHDMTPTTSGENMIIIILLYYIIILYYLLYSAPLADNWVGPRDWCHAPVQRVVNPAPRL